MTDHQETELDGKAEADEEELNAGAQWMVSPYLFCSHLITDATGDLMSTACGGELLKVHAKVLKLNAAPVGIATCTIC